MPRQIAICVGLYSLLLLSGCGGKKGPEMVDINGTVTYKGVPIKEGAIRFVPETGETTRVTPVQITDGKYAASGDRGLAVGKYTVEFHSYEDDLKKSADPAQDGGDVMPGMVVKKELLPEKYHKKSTEKLAVPSGSGSLTKDFKLE